MSSEILLKQAISRFLVESTVPIRFMNGYCALLTKYLEENADAQSTIPLEYTAEISKAIQQLQSLHAEFNTITEAL